MRASGRGPPEWPASRRAAPVLIAATALALAAACGGEDEPPTLPEEMVGYWTTTAPLYADRAFELRREAVIFYTGTGLFDFTAHPVKDVEVSRDEEDGRLVTVHYTDGGMPYEFSFRFVPGEPDEIRFSNRQGIAWSRDDPPWLGMEETPSGTPGSS